MSTYEALNIAALELRLRKEREALLARIKEQLHGSGDPAQYALAGRFEEIGGWALADLQGHIDPALLGFEVSGLRDIDEALKRIARGNYGTCDGCGKAIDSRRLEKQPAVRLCLGCKEAFEKRRGIVLLPAS